MAKSHTVTATIEGQLIKGFQSGNLESSLITPADQFVLRLPFSRSAWNTLRIDAKISIHVDGVTLLVGFVDKRIRRSKADLIEVSGRDLVGRLVDESAPAIDYTGMTILEAVRRLAFPWFQTITTSNLRNRRLRRGKGRRVAAGNEPVVTINVRVPRQGAVHPGQSRWQLIHEIVSRAGFIAFSSADGKELVIGKPNHTQAPQFVFCMPEPGAKSRTTLRDLTVTEDSSDRFSLYLCAGVGGQTDTNFGTNVVDNRGVAFDNEFNRTDGTGRDFLRPKRMFLPERAYESFHDAQRVAELERARRDYKRHQVAVETHGCGQFLENDAITFFAPDTVARVIDEQLDIDDNYLVTECSYSFDRDNGDTTTMHMVPTGTEIVL